MSDPLFDDDCDDIQARRNTHADNNAREQKLWGNLLPDMRLLRSRGFGVWMLPDGKINVGTQKLTATQFKEKAARERRLMT